MKASILFATSLVLAAGALVGSGSAQAGEGGTAGSVGIKFVTVTAGAPGGPAAPAVRSISSSISIGKNAAAATARTNAADTFTSAIGGGGGASVAANVATEGGLTVTNASDTTASYTLQADGALGTVGGQANTFAASQATLSATDGITLGNPVGP
jgi:hypothetical protein